MHPNLTFAELEFFTPDAGVLPVIEPPISVPPPPWPDLSVTLAASPGE